MLLGSNRAPAAAIATLLPMPTVIPLSVRLAAFHESQRDWHREMAEQDHLEAAAAHAPRLAVGIMAAVRWQPSRKRHTTYMNITTRRYLQAGFAFHRSGP